MKNVLEVGPDAITYTPTFEKIGSAVQNLIREIHRHTQTAWRWHNSIFILQNKESSLKIKVG
jgi:hypothetical protein